MRASGYPYSFICSLLSELVKLTGGRYSRVQPLVWHCARYCSSEIAVFTDPGVIFRSGSSPASETTVQQAATVARTNAPTQSLIDHLRALLIRVPHATSD